MSIRYILRIFKKTLFSKFIFHKMYVHVLIQVFIHAQNELD